MTTLEIVMGDWSNDGHGRTEKVVISTDFTREEVEKAFKAGVEKTGFDITTHCEDYEDGSVPNALYDYFDKAGVEYGNIREDNESTQGIGYDDFVKIWFKTCEIGNPDFKYTQVSHYENEIRIGGYGLFCN